MNSKFDQYDVRYLIEQYYKMKEIYENDDAIVQDKGKLATMKKAFKSYDKDGNGVLDRREVVDLLTNHYKEQGIKRRPTKQDVDEFFDNLDEDHSGVIDFEEFKHFLIDNMRQKLLAPLGTYLKSKGVELWNNRLMIKYKNSWLA